MAKNVLLQSAQTKARVWLVLELLVTIALIGLGIYIIDHLGPSSTNFWLSWNVWRYIMAIVVATIVLVSNARLTNAMKLTFFLPHIMFLGISIAYFAVVILYELFFVIYSLPNGFKWNCHNAPWCTKPALGAVGELECPDPSNTLCKTDEKCVQFPEGTFECHSKNVQMELIIFLALNGAMIIIQYLFGTVATEMKKVIQTYEMSLPTGDTYPNLSLNTLHSDERDSVMSQLVAAPPQGNARRLHVTPMYESQ